MVSNAYFGAIRSLGFAGISGAYAVVGSAFTEMVRIICFSNGTEGDVLFTNNVTQDQVFVAAGANKLYDIQSNINPQFDDKYVIPIGTQWYVKQLEAPVSGSVYIETIF